VAGSLGVWAAVSTMRTGAPFGWTGSGCSIGPWTETGAGREPIDDAEVERIATQFIASYGGDHLEIAEIVVFGNHLYVEAREPDTNRYAFEFLIDRYTGRAAPEPGPNMMWNLKYGGMSQWMMGQRLYSIDEETSTVITADQARERAQAYLDRVHSGLTIGEHAAAYYGYYTLHTLRDGVIAGMLSVNETTGEVWPHTWHGEYLGTLIDHEE
jgi:hypothetical protein